MIKFPTMNLDPGLIHLRPSTQPETSGCCLSSFGSLLYINMYAVSL